MKDRIYTYIKENQENSLCDYIEIRDTLKITDEQISKALKQLVKEGRVNYHHQNQ